MKKKRNLAKYKGVIIVLIIVFLGLVFTPLNITSKARNYFWVTIRPLGIAFEKTIGKAFPFVKNIFHIGTVINENTNLISENLDLQSQLALLTETKNENEILKKELGFMNTASPLTSLPSAVIGRSSGYLKSVVIDKGENAGIKKGQAVVSHGILIGAVTTVRASNSEVTLITDFSSLIPVVLQNSRGTGLLRGGLSGITVEEIPLNIGIATGENVVTSGLGGEIPPGILVGKVSSVVSKSGEIFQKASVSSQIDFSNLQVVFVQKTNE